MEKGLKKLIDAAKEENWDYIDERIQEISKNNTYISWAIKSGVDNEDGNVRDLAVSILGKTKLGKSEFQGVETKLHRLLYDSNKYVRYRTAFALMEQNLEEYGTNHMVIKTLKEAKNDEAVSDLANWYLEHRMQ